jgi:acetyl-CoA synthetase
MRGLGTFGTSEGAVWLPSAQDLKRSRLAAAMQRWGYADVAELHAASVDQPELFWPAALDDLDVTFAAPPAAIRDDSAGLAFPRWFTGGRLNAATNCVHRHAAAAHAGKPAVVYEGDGGRLRQLTYRELGRDVDRFAAWLRAAGVGRGDRVGLYLPVSPEAVVAFMACAHVGAIAVPAFSGYGADALATRLRDAGVVLLVTADGSTRRGKPVPMKDIADAAAAAAPAVRSLVVVRNTGIDVTMTPGRDQWWHELPDQPQAPPEPMDANDPLAIIYTSGTSGKPKGIVHSHGGFLVKAALDFGYLFDVQEDDVVAWTADLGWMLGPLLMLGGLHFGATIVLIEGVPDFPDGQRLWDIARRHQVTVLGIAPTAARTLRSRADAMPAPGLDHLRAFASTGEPWDEPTWRWLFDEVGGSRHPILNYSGGTETGGGILSSYTILPQQPGTLGGPVLGMDVGIYADGAPAEPGTVGELVVLNTWPGMTHSFWRDDARYLETYWSRWPGIWVHGDLVSVQPGGHWTVHGRSDDTIKIAGRRVGPAEIEAGLMAHPAVAEAAVIGVPDPLRGQRAVGFVVRQPGPDLRLAEQDLRAEVLGHVGKALLPSGVHIVAGLPKTKNGKIMRRAIRARYLGLEPGDLSALDPQFPLEHIPGLPATGHAWLIDETDKDGKQ